MSQQHNYHSLFEDLCEIVKRDGYQWNGNFLSDLRYNRRLLWHALRLIRRRRYETREWLELIRYLLWRP